MKYMGSKNRHSNELLKIILKDRKSDQWYIEPFVGGFNMIDKVAGNRIANDSHYYLIELFKAIQLGWKPPINITEQEYQNIRINKNNYEPALVGFVGFGCSYSGKWFGGYARGNTNKGEPRNYCNESRKNILKQYDGIQGIKIINKFYSDVELPPNSIVYCDPPYFQTTNYTNVFDHDIFWEWVRQLVKKNHSVFVSEYTAPDDFIPIWSKQVNNTLVKNTGSKKGIEKLFVHNSTNFSN